MPRALARGVDRVAPRPIHKVNVQQAIDDLVSSGAAFYPVLTSIPRTVGLHLNTGWNRWFWWEAGGDTEFSGHLLACDSAEVLYDGLAVKFTAGGEMVGYLTTIAESFENETSVAAEQVMLAEWRAEFDRNAEFRAFVMRQSLR